MDMMQIAEAPLAGASNVDGVLAPPTNTNTATALAEIWRGSLGPKGRDPDSHILRVTYGLKRISRLLREAETEFGVKIPPSALFQLGTARSVAAALEQNVWPAPNALVLLRDGSPDQIACIPSPGSGVVIEVCDLAQLLDFPGRIYGLHLPGIDGEAPPLDSIEAMARHYVDAMRAQHPTALCHLIGYSFAGLVVAEMARIMPACGLRVGLVALLDTGCYEKFWPRHAWLRFALKQARRRLDQMREMKRGEAARFLGGKVFAVLRHVRRRLNPPASAVAADLTKSIHYTGGYDPDFQRVRDAGLVAYERYRPSRLDIRCVLFKSATGEPHACDPEHIWRPLIRNLEVVRVPGSHTTMVRKPMAVALARELSRHLAASSEGDIPNGSPA